MVTQAASDIRFYIVGMCILIVQGILIVIFFSRKKKVRYGFLPADKIYLIPTIKTSPTYFPYLVDHQHCPVFHFLLSFVVSFVFFPYYVPHHLDTIEHSNVLWYPTLGQ